MNPTISRWLRDDENQTLRELIGDGCKANGVAVVRLYFVKDVYQWTRNGCFVACYIRDSNQRAHFIRAYDIISKKLVLDQELYYEMVYDCKLPRFHVMQSDVGPVGLSFADGQDAKWFSDNILRRLNFSNAKKTDQGHGMAVPVNKIDLSASQPHTQGGIAQLNKPSFLDFRTAFLPKQKVTKGKNKLDKLVISQPTNFQHIHHVGFDQQTGQLQPNGQDSDMIRQILKLINREDQLKTAQDVKFINDYLNNYGGVERVHNMTKGLSIVHPVPPPVPPSQGASRTPPQVPPPPPVPPSQGASRTPPQVPPPPPPPISSNTTRVPPPPPPPLSLKPSGGGEGGGGGGTGAPIPPPPILSGVSVVSAGGGGEAKTGAPAGPPPAPALPRVGLDLQSEITAFSKANLRKAEDRELPAPDASQPAGLDLLSSLATALDQRRNQMMQDIEDSDSDGNYNGNDSEEWDT